MALESASQIQNLVPANPEAGDNVSQGDDHLRMIKLCLQNSFPNMTAPWTTTSRINCANPVNQQDAMTLNYYNNNLVLPIGYPFLWLMPVLPAGHIGLEGQTLLRATYPKLFALYGVSYGSTAADNFKMPDVRGYFMRFADLSSGRDPDHATRTPRADGGTFVGTTQNSINKAHIHELEQTTGTDKVVTSANGVGPTKNGPGSNLAASVTTKSLTTTTEGGAESRPINFSFYLICRAG